MPALSLVRASNATFHSSYSPVAVFVGGTSGIGQAMVERFARLTKGNSNIIIVGRNRTAAETIFASLPPAPSPGTYAREFIQCDATLMSNVHTASQEILSRYTKINYLILSPGILTLKGREETSEGIDKKLALHYYARWKFIHDLLPSLERAKEAGEEAKAMSVLAAGKGGEIDMEDLGLKKTFSLSKAGLTAPTYNDLMLKMYASLHPKLSFVHAFPGLVRTPILSSSSSALLSLTSSLVMGLVYPFSYSVEDCGENMWYALLGAKDGFTRTDQKGDDIGMKRYFGNEVQIKKLWEHTKETTGVKDDAD
ncbi:NAD(P)-binding protein [Phlegmacium glaucopus]|nr:NAD(P)-binding protein [Phlegmacium glaucopus]